MFFNIARKNIQKSFKDYSIYFLTLSFAVCIFYAFNSIGSQSAMTKLSTNTADYMTAMNNITNVLSIFVSVILGALIIYANNFLIKRRKKELGIYTTLGMSKRKISSILVLETLMVGIVSLIVGLIVGLIVSQGLSVLTAHLFGGIITKMTFVISYSAIGKTILYFGIIFVLVMIFNTVIVSKYKLIDLLTAGKKNEKIKIKNPVLLLVIFIVGVALLVSGYAVIIKNGLDSMSALYTAIGLGFVGTFLFFYGLAGFMVVVSQKNKNRYLRGLNIFVTKQMNNKINTNFVSMALISLMLFVTISALSTGVSMKNAMTNSLKQNTPFTVTTSVYGGDESKNSQYVNLIENTLYKGVNNDLDTIVYNMPYIEQSIYIKGTNSECKQMASYITLNDYNKYLKLMGKPSVSLGDNEVIVTSNVSKVINSIAPIMKEKPNIEINGKSYSVKNSIVEQDVFENNISSSNYLTIVVPNNFVDVNAPKDPSSSLVVASMIKKGANSQVVQKQIDENFNQYGKSTQGQKINVYFAVSTHDGMFEQSQGFTTIILFIAIYIGVIFLLTSSAIIALQQLVEATDSKERYDVLRKIGATNKMINKAIFKQVVTAFALPLVLAIVDSIVAIKAVSSFIEAFGKSGIVGASVITAGIIVIIYGGYMIATYFGFKNAVKENK
ncbi:MAG: FtsX-like permease family protein [Sarcina sp.]